MIGGDRAILVVDDESSVRDLLGRVLRQEGYSVFTASDGDAAWKLMKNISIDMIILDLRMPGMDGVELCRRVREDPLTREVPVIVASGGERHICQVGGLDDGADDYIVKPFDPRELLMHVSELFRRCATKPQVARVKHWRGDQGGVLIVDDDPAIRRLLTRVLHEICPKRHLEEATDVPQAKSMIVDLRPRLIISDIRLPSGSGSDLCHFIQGHPWFYKTRVLIITGYPSDEIRDEVFAEGASEFLPKPFQARDLASSIERLLA